MDAKSSLRLGNLFIFTSLGVNYTKLTVNKHRGL